MTSGLDTSQFEPRVLKRGESYLREGRVGEVMPIAPGVFHSEVRGTALYDVTVRMDDQGRFTSVTCTCPAAAASCCRCKHAAAVMLAIERERNEEDERDERTAFAKRDEESSPSESPSRASPLRDAPGPVPVDVYQAVRSYCTSWFGETDGHGPLLVWDSRIADECPIPSGTQFPVLGLQQAGRMAEGTVQVTLDAGDDEEWGDCDDDDWFDGDAADAGVMSAFAGANDVLDNALATDDYEAAMRNAVAVMRIANDALEYFDSSGDAEDCVERLGWKVRLLMEKAARDVDADQKILNVMASVLTDAIRDDGSGWNVARNGMVPGLLSFSARTHTRRIADEALSELESAAAHDEDSQEWLSLLHALRHDDLLLAKEYDHMRQYESDHLEDGMMAKLAVARAVLADDFVRVRELVRRHMDTTPDTASWRGFKVLPDTTFPYGWTTVLIASAQYLGDRNELEKLYGNIIVQGGRRNSWIAGASEEDDRKNVDGLKALVGGRRWRNRTLPDIIARCRERDDENRVYEYLLQSESLIAESLDYCNRVPRAIDRLYEFVAAARAEQATDLLLKPYEGARAFVGTVPRAEYRKVADRLRRTVPFMGGAWAAEYARSLVARYPRRVNLKAALKGLL